MAPRDSTLLHLTVQDSDPARAAGLANSLAAEMIAASPALSGRATRRSSSPSTTTSPATQTQIKDAQTEIQRLSGLPSRSVADEQQLQAAPGPDRHAAPDLRDAARLLVEQRGEPADRRGPGRRRPTDPASPRVLLNTLIAALVGLLLAVGLGVPPRVPRRHDQVQRRGRGGGRAADAGHGPEDAGRQGSQGDLPTRHAALPSLAGGRVLPDAALEHRVRRRRRAGEDAAGDELDPGRRQDDDGCQPRGRHRPGRPSDDPARCGLPQARGPQDVRPAERRRALQPPAR